VARYSVFILRSSLSSFFESESSVSSNDSNESIVIGREYFEFRGTSLEWINQIRSRS